MKTSRLPARASRRPAASAPESAQIQQLRADLLAGIEELVAQLRSAVDAREAAERGEVRTQVSLAPIRPLLRIEHICELLDISQAQFYALKDQGFFHRHGLLVEAPKVDRMPRYYGAPFVTWLQLPASARDLGAALEHLPAAGLDRPLRAAR